MGEYAKPVLVDTEWVAAHLDDPAVVVAEVDENPDLYDEGHIPGAVKLHWRDDLQDAVERDIVDRETFERVLGMRGIGNDTTVVLYGDKNNWFAAYAYWYFKVYGHDAVSLMDGGRKLWEAEGRPLTDEPAKVSPTSGYQARELDADIRAVRDQVLAEYVGAPGDRRLIDVRSPALAARLEGVDVVVHLAVPVARLVEDRGEDRPEGHVVLLDVVRGRERGLLDVRFLHEHEVGRAALAAKPKPGLPPRLSPAQQQKLDRMLRRIAARERLTIRRAVDLVRDRFGVTYSEQGLAHRLRRMGWRRAGSRTRPVWINH